MSEQPKRQKTDLNKKIIEKHFTLHGLTKKKKILTALPPACLFIILVISMRFEPSIITNSGETIFQKELSFLSNKEKKRVQNLFDYHFFFSDFAYTLFGSKPMSIGRLLPTKKAKIGWKAWEKINSSFGSKEFIIRKYTFNNNEFILVANLKEIERIYHQNQPRFEKSFKGRMAFDALVSCLREDGPLFQELMHDHLFVGILLGYGPGNAELFSENQKISNKKKTILYASSGKTHPIFYLFSEVMPVSFACDPNTDETKELKRRYTKERKAILKMAKRDVLFFQMLKKLHMPLVTQETDS